jgi:hypothetical protein
MDSGKIEGFARARGIEGPIDYVGIVVSPRLSAAGVLYINVGGTVSPRSKISCRKVTGVASKRLLVCGGTVAPIGIVDLTVGFGEDSIDPEAATMDAMYYVVSDVLCEP